MAKKGQIFNKYTYDFKMKVYNDYLESKCPTSHMAKKYNISRKTIETWIYKFRDLGTLKNCKRGPIKELDIDYKEKYEILKKYQAFLKAQRERK